MIKYINNKFENFVNLINEEIEKIFTDEYNDKIKKLSNLLDKFNFNKNENKFNEIFTIFNKSIFNLEEILEYNVNLNENDYSDKCIL